MIITDFWIATMSSSSTSSEEEQEREKGEKPPSSSSSIVDILVMVSDVCNQETYLKIDGFGLDGGVPSS